MEAKKKNGKGAIIVIVILLILVIALGGYIGYDKFLSKDSKSTNTTEKNSKNETNTKNEIQNTETNTKNEIQNTEDNENIKTETNEYSSNKVKCYGTYYVNGDANQGIYTLKEDGTYQVQNEENFGVFTINENTITFIEMKHTTGPRDEDPIYHNPKSYLIYDDCSKIRLTEPGSHTSASLDKVN